MNLPAPTAAALPLAQLLNHAADAVQAVRAGESLDAALARCPQPARPGAQALAFHALRWLGSATAVRALLAPRRPAPAVDALLVTALAQRWPVPVPGSGPREPPSYDAHTLVDQAVAAARQRVPQSAGFVNAVLRRFLREESALVEAAQRTPEGRFNHPAWWVDRLRADWPDRWQAILDADNRRAPMTLRVNARRSSVPAYLARLGEHGLAARQVGPQAVRLDRPCSVTLLPGFADGAVSVQDAAAQRAAPLLVGGGIASAGRLPRVLDACAAPGGKTAHLLEIADLDLLALDRDPLRLARVDATLARLGLVARTLAADAAEPAGWWDGRPFDAILLDAPCSAAGIVRRHPDVRWLRRAADLPALAAQQARLLEALWPLLRPGGRLLYATCSVFKLEGESRIDAFSQRHPEAVQPSSPLAPGHLLPLPDNRGAVAGGVADGLAAGPPPTPSDDFPSASPDGFFYALIEKTP